MNGGHGTATLAQPGCGGVGLVPSQTKVNDRFTISLDPSENAQRRVNRLKKAVWASGHCHKLTDDGSRPAVPWFVTLTYRLERAWKPDHMKKSVNRFRAFCKRRGVPCRYTWVAEIQPKRLERTGESVVHYHLLAWLPVGLNMPFWDLPLGKHAPFWTHGSTERDIARTGVGYLMKYLSKLGALMIFPKGIRLYGIGGLDKCGKNVRQWLNLPEWAKRSYGVGDLSRVAGSLVVRATGEVLAPMFRVQFLSGNLQLQALRDVPEKFHAGAYSTFPQA